MYSIKSIVSLDTIDSMFIINFSNYHMPCAVSPESHAAGGTDLHLKRQET